MPAKKARAKPAPAKARATSAASKPAKMTVGTPNKAGASWNVRADKYEAMKKALLKVVPKKGPGVTQQEMFDRVRPLVSAEEFPGTTHTWWVKSVQLNLEKTGEMSRDVNAKPLRWTKK